MAMAKWRRGFGSANLLRIGRNSNVRFVPKPDELHRSKIAHSISSSALS
jgi:hypothetical protein